MKHNLKTWAMLATVVLLAGISVTAQTFAVKTGLWEVTSLGQTAGTLPIDTSKMTPERRARAEAAMKARQNAGPVTRTRRICITKERLAKDPFDDQRDASCKKTVVSDTATVKEFSVECDASGAHTSGRMRIEALTSESIKQTGQMAVARGGGQMTVNVNVTGKWISNSCGDVK